MSMFRDVPINYEVICMGCHDRILMRYSSRCVTCANFTCNKCGIIIDGDEDERVICNVCYRNSCNNCMEETDRVCSVCENVRYCEKCLFCENVSLMECITCEQLCCFNRKTSEMMCKCRCGGDFNSIYCRRIIKRIITEAPIIVRNIGSNMLLQVYISSQLRNIAHELSINLSNKTMINILVTRPDLIKKVRHHVLNKIPPKMTIDIHVKGLNATYCLTRIH